MRYCIYIRPEEESFVENNRQIRLPKLTLDLRLLAWVITITPHVGRFTTRKSRYR